MSKFKVGDRVRSDGGLLNRNGWREFIKGVYWMPLPQPPEVKP